MELMESNIMKGFDRKRSGQFVIISAVIIAAFTLSLVLSIHQITLNNQQLTYQPVEELVLGITSDLDRCLTHALSVATNEYYKTGSDVSAINAGNSFIIKWTNATIASQSNIGLKMMMKENVTEGKIDVDWWIDWGLEGGISSVGVDFSMDMEAYGFKGWVGSSGKYVFISILDNSSTTIDFELGEGKNDEVLKPVENLEPEFVIIVLNKTGVCQPTLVTNLEYLGRGIYRATFASDYDFSKDILNITVVTPDDNIIVGAYILNRSYYVDMDEWRTLYLSHDQQEKAVIVPYRVVKTGHIPSYANQPRTVFNAMSPQTPFNITLAPLVNVTLYIGVDPKKSTKTVGVELNFTYNEKNYTIGRDSKDFTGDGMYTFQLDTTKVTLWPYPDQPGLVPEGSRFILTVWAEFSKEPYGTVKVYFGPNRPSHIELF